MTDLDGEFEAMRAEARKKLDAEAELRKPVEPLPDLAPAPAFNVATSSKEKEDDEDEREEREEKAEAAKAKERADAQAQVQAQATVLELAAKAATKAPGAIAGGVKLAGKARGLSLIQQVALAVVGLIALVVLWSFVLKPLIQIAIFVGIVALVVLLLVKLFGGGSKSAAADDDDEEDDEDDDDDDKD